MSVNESARPGIVPNPHISALPIYNAGMNIRLARQLSGHDDIAALASNENPNGCSPKVMEAMASSAFNPSRYSDPACTELRNALSRLLDLPPGQIVVGNGSEEMVAAISRAFLVQGSSALTVTPSFGLHEIEPLAAGARVTKVPMTSDMGFDIPALEAALATGPALFFLPSPSNPVGAALTRSELDRLVAATRPQTLFVLDEAYFEYMEEGQADGMALVRSGNFPSIVLRTFSKAYGLAGLRVGYATCSNPEIARIVAAAKPPFNVNAAAQVAAVAALADQQWMKQSVERTKTERARLARGLDELGVFTASSQTNFLFFRTTLPSEHAAKALLADGIIVKPWREAGYENWVRVTIGTPKQNDRVLASLNHILNGAS
ncbi:MULTISPECIES: histidinol-phosphate transaminase [unclassified Rhizobium]|uniref:histidinol-phosphate transaminase n=1 Tax=unclassified Rhizobium TaxID=2613769 RepID=UPI001C840788|nr:MULTISPECIES: histidinol-phosphate transaminase [unclassified Rhizobium]MBX5163098.1 histidinol-phosphate transaminase [Rhizobium sp. NZLR4b]MBX5168913.1 histidinol-phosphate transaminase [Rhizobium sp. NZLR1b]MBX5183983.1 histidinol-phosphate transaminase [Rhizobium sp. NZLR5]MBX5195215.1 histidinol-phosphate transaminase [Rhizobium sp. NZLR10]MBX5207517.1 histidinol-phosphate transaminase [Rhizobium sp. NZLR11]